MSEASRLVSLMGRIASERAARGRPPPASRPRLLRRQGNPRHPRDAEPRGAAGGQPVGGRLGAVRQRRLRQCASRLQLRRAGGALVVSASRPLGAASGAAELHRREGCQLTLQPALRGTCGGDDDDVVMAHGHASIFRDSEMIRAGSVAATTSSRCAIAAAPADAPPTRATATTGCGCSTRTPLRRPTP